VTTIHFASSTTYAKCNDQDGFFGQVREAILSLAKEPSVIDVPQPSASVTHDNSATADAGDMPPTKKRKVNPFDWSQHASVPTDVSSASTAIESAASLKDRVLKEIRSYETEPLLCHAESDVLIPSTISD